MAAHASGTDICLGLEYPLSENHLYAVCSTALKTLQTPLLTCTRSCWERILYVFGNPLVLVLSPSDTGSMKAAKTKWGLFIVLRACWNLRLARQNAKASRLATPHLLLGHAAGYFIGVAKPRDFYMLGLRKEPPDYAQQSRSPEFPKTRPIKQLST